MDASTHLKRAYLLLDFGEWDPALQACEQARQTAPNHWLPDTLKGAILAARGDLQDAVKVLKRVVERHPDHAYPRIQLAEVTFLLGARPSAERHLVRAQTASDFEEYRELFDSLRTFIDAGAH